VSSDACSPAPQGPIAWGRLAVPVARRGHTAY
jgi:hypothetical protein